MTVVITTISISRLSRLKTKCMDLWLAWHCFGLPLVGLAAVLLPLLASAVVGLGGDGFAASWLVEAVAFAIASLS